MFPEQLVCRVSDFTKEREIVLGRDYGAVPQPSVPRWGETIRGESLV